MNITITMQKNTIVEISLDFLSGEMLQCTIV